MGRPREIDLALVVRYLKAAKSPKEIAYLLTHEHGMECSVWAIFKIIDRSDHVQAAYADTYPLRKAKSIYEETPAQKVVELKAV